MQTRSLGRTDLVLSEIALGTWGLAEQTYGPVPPERLDRVIAAAIEAGVTTFDVAPLWGDGEAERRVGHFLAESKLEEPVVITRGGAERVEGKLRQSFASDDLVRGCEASLERLGRDTIELFLLHNPGVEELRREAWREAVESLEQEGKIRAWGVSVGSADEARVALAAGARAVCLTYHMVSPEMLDDLASDLARSGAGVLARSPLSHGLLAGQWSSSRLFGAGDHRARRWSANTFMQRVHETNKLRQAVGPEHRDLPTAALAFVLKNPAVASALVGARTPAQILAAAEASS